MSCDKFSTMFLIIVLIISVFFNLIFLWFIYWVRKYNVPGPIPLPIFGNSLDLGTTGKDILKNWLNITKTYGGFHKLYLGPVMKLVFAKPEVMEKILESNTNLSKSDIYDFLRPWLGNGLLVNTGAPWRSRRKLLTPTFHFKILDEFLKIFESTCDVLMEKLSEKSGQFLDIFPIINLYSLDIICESAMGVQINAQLNEDSEYVKAVKTFLQTVIQRNFSSWERFDFLYRFSSSYKVRNDALKILHEFTYNVIKKKREEHKNKTFVKTENEEGIKRKVAFLDLLLESEEGNSLTDKDLADEVDTFMFEGHDTSSSGIAFALYALASNPQMQEKLYEEEISHTLDVKLTNKTIQDLKYLDLFLKESLRMYPPVSLIERRLDEDTEFEGTKFPKGTEIMLFLYGLHQNEEYFPEPEKFIPERFLNENGVKNNFAYVPFSAGPRNCIGKRFVLLEMKLTLVRILQKFRIVAAPNFKPTLELVGILKSENGIHVKFEPRVA